MNSISQNLSHQKSNSQFLIFTPSPSSIDSLAAFTAVIYFIKNLPVNPNSLTDQFAVHHHLYGLLYLTLFSQLIYHTSQPITFPIAYHDTINSLNIL